MASVLKNNLPNILIISEIRVHKAHKRAQVITSYSFLQDHNLIHLIIKKKINVKSGTSMKQNYFKHTLMCMALFNQD